VVTENGIGGTACVVEVASGTVVLGTVVAAVGGDGGDVEGIGVSVATGDVAGVEWAGDVVTDSPPPPHATISRQTAVARILMRIVHRL
jgi:hypothetical protein